MRQVRDKTSAVKFGMQYMPHNTKGFQEVYNHATQHPFSYLFIDLTQVTLENERLRSNIFGEENRPALVYTV